MKLTLDGIKDRQFESAGIKLPTYDVEETAERTKSSPIWVHFGIGNIFRIFPAAIADELLNAGELDRGIVCVEGFDPEIVDAVCKPYDNLALCVTQGCDGSEKRWVTGSIAEALALYKEDKKAGKRLEEIFENPGLMLATYTITEKGYALRDSAGNFFETVREDIENGPDSYSNNTMSLVAALLKRRFEAGAFPVAMVSMDNVSHNGEKLRESVLTIVREWEKRGFVSAEFVEYVSDEGRVSFPWTMIDKITPRPSEAAARALEDIGVEDMEITVTSKKTYIAPFVNAEVPQYLVIEDSFPNGRPPLERGKGVYLTDRKTVDAAERMKVTVCLNPIHTALAPYGCLLDIPTFSEVFLDPQLHRLAELVGLKEGMEVVASPGILSPEAFMAELFDERFPNPYLPDTPQRITVDISQMLGIRFGVTINAFISKYGDAGRLKGIPIAVAGWLRYLLGVRDDLSEFTLSPDPMNEELCGRLKGIRVGEPESVCGQLHQVLSNKNIFGADLYAAGIGGRIEEIFKEEIAGAGAVRAALTKYL